MIGGEDNVMSKADRRYEVLYKLVGGARTELELEIDAAWCGSCCGFLTFAQCTAPETSASGKDAIVPHSFHSLHLC